MTHGSSLGFFDESFIYTCDRISEIIALMSFIDLDFKTAKSETDLQNKNLSIKTSQNAVLFSKEIKEQKAELLDLDVLIAQRFFDPTDRYLYDEQDSNLKIEKQVEEYIVGKMYGTRIVVTNSTVSDLDLNIITEIPQGAIPLCSQDTLKVNYVKVNSLQTHTLELQFYFPKAGAFSIYPATVVKNGKIVAMASTGVQFEVKTALTKKKLETIRDILAMGNIDDIIRFTESKNILNPAIFNFNEIYWLLKNKAFYQKFLGVLRGKGIYDHTVWSFSIFHADLPTFVEFLKSDRNVSRVKSLATTLDSGLLRFNNFEVREYYPLVNPRAHSLGKNRQNIINNQFKQTYRKFLTSVLESNRLDVENALILLMYLINQDRFEESLSLFKSLDASQIEAVGTKIQYDYISAYLDFIEGYPEFERAKRICQEYLTYPVLTWRNLFIEIANQLAEFEEKEIIENLIDEKERKKDNKEKAKEAPEFSCKMEQASIKVQSKKISSLSVKYYKIDLEVLFSLDPFRGNKNFNYSHVLPFHQEQVALQNTADFKTYVHPLPETIRAENLYIEVSHIHKGQNQPQFIQYIPFHLTHYLNNDFGIIKLIDMKEKKPVPKVYVKCFAKYSNGSVKFYKDGYTDLRGSFDFVSLNKDKIDDISKFSLIVVSQQFGFKMLQCDPPKKIGRVEGEAKELVGKQWQ